MVMTVHAIEHFNAHPEKACCLPLVHACLHEPRRSGVAQRMRADSAFEVRSARGTFECRLDRLHRTAGPFDHVIAHPAFRGPSAKVRKQTWRDRYRWLALLSLGTTFSQSIKQAFVNIDERAPRAFLERGSGNGAGPCPCVEANQNEPGQL